MRGSTEARQEQLDCRRFFCAHSVHIYVLCVCCTGIRYALLLVHRNGVPPPPREQPVFYVQSFRVINVVPRFIHVPSLVVWYPLCLYIRYLVHDTWYSSYYSYSVHGIQKVVTTVYQVSWGGIFRDFFPTGRWWDAVCTERERARATCRLWMICSYKHKYHSWRFSNFYKMWRKTEKWNTFS